MFNEKQFVPTKWNSAADKARFANHFVRFVESGFRRTLFHKWFYVRLSMTFGHIAHYDINGFFAHFFETPEDRLMFVEQCIRHACYGDPTWTYSDVEKELRKWLIANRKTIESKVA